MYEKNHSLAVFHLQIKCVCEFVACVSCRPDYIALSLIALRKGLDQYINTTVYRKYIKLIIVFFVYIHIHHRLAKTVWASTVGLANWMLTSCVQFKKYFISAYFHWQICFSSLSLGKHCQYDYHIFRLIDKGVVYQHHLRCCH